MMQPCKKQRTIRLVILQHYVTAQNLFLYSNLQTSVIAVFMCLKHTVYYILCFYRNWSLQLL